VAECFSHGAKEARTGPRRLVSNEVEPARERVPDDDGYNSDASESV